MTKTFEENLKSLPVYSEQVGICTTDYCSDGAVIRHPATGKFHCATHALELAQSHPSDMSDIALAIGIRKRLLDKKMECDDCDKQAERICAYCFAPICFDHMQYIPRTGAACSGCALMLEREQESRQFWG